MTTEREAKWAAIIDDRLVPMPRRKLKARDILYQAGVADGKVLVRDLNSPNDVGFAPDAIVDLGEGNVFRTAIDCEVSLEIRHPAPAKLAFIVDDRWEVTIQPKQTGKSLHGLLGLPDGSQLFRDYESPVDEPIEDGEHINFADGPVFITRKGNPHAVTIIVEGTAHEWDKPSITYAQVATLFDPSYPQHPEITYSITYKRGPNHKPEGILSPGASVKVKDKMVFNVSATGQS